VESQNKSDADYNEVERSLAKVAGHLNGDRAPALDTQREKDAQRGGKWAAQAQQRQKEKRVLEEKI